MLSSEKIPLADLTEFIVAVNSRLERIEQLLSATDSVKGFQKDWYTIPEAAKLLDKQPFTIREWCRLMQVHAQKRKCGRGRTSEWVISKSEIERYLNEGLLPIRNQVQL